MVRATVPRAPSGEGAAAIRRRWRSIRFGLSRAFVLFLALLLFLGLFGIQALSAVNRISAEIRDRWLQSTRVLGDLNNYTSDARAAEASRLLAITADQQASIDRQLSQLYAEVAASDQAYRTIPHDKEEWRLYSKFRRAWRAYKAVSAELLHKARSAADPRETARLYMTRSQVTYNAASDILGVLTNRTVNLAASANRKAIAIYDAARVLTLLIILAAGLVVLAAVSYINRFITGPILELAARMRSLADNDLKIAIDGQRRQDEIGEMARAVAVFRTNAVELAHSQHGLVQQAAMLSEKLEAEQALTGLQRNFLAMASHEFRTPLTIIDGHAQRLIAMQNRLTPADIAARASRIRRTVRQMTVLIERLLSSSRIVDGSPPQLYFHPQPVNLAALVQDVCITHRDLEPEATIIEGCGLKETMINGDSNLLTQLLSNLIANSVRYSEDRIWIKVDLRTDEVDAYVVVEDQGTGIPEADIDKVFERFYRGRNVTGTVGTGIGLYLVKMVAELHGGDVSVQSRDGEGATFTCRLPLTRTYASSSMSQ